MNCITKTLCLILMATASLAQAEGWFTSQVAGFRSAFAAHYKNFTESRYFVPAMAGIAGVGLFTAYKIHQRRKQQYDLRATATPSLSSLPSYSASLPSGIGGSSSSAAIPSSSSVASSSLSVGSSSSLSSSSFSIASSSAALSPEEWDKKHQSARQQQMRIPQNLLTLSQRFTEGLAAFLKDFEIEPKDLFVEEVEKQLIEANRQYVFHKRTTYAFKLPDHFTSPTKTTERIAILPNFTVTIKCHANDDNEKVIEILTEPHAPQQG